MKCSGLHYLTGASLQVETGQTITAVDELIQPLPLGSPYLAPGFIDLQVNGFAGADFCSPETPQDDIARAMRAIFSTGCTRFLPTVITSGKDETLGALRNLARARASLPGGHAMVGFHVEGPHISPLDGPRGAHPARQVRPPDIDEFHRWQEAAEGGVKLVTLSPEWPGAPAYIEHLVKQGVVAAIGHLAATRDQIDAAVSAGATLSTHLGNGAHRELPRHPNYLWHQMAEDRLAASLIVDGIHLDRHFLTVALRAKGLERCILITDAVMPAECEPGHYMLGEVEVELKPDRRVVLRGGERLAGSSLRMDRGIENMMRLGGLTLGEAIATATRNPARIGRVAGRQRGIEPGEFADLVEFAYDKGTKSISVLRTWLEGECVYEARA